MSGDLNLPGIRCATISRVGKAAVKARTDPRSWKALTARVRTYRWQIDRIKQGLREAQAGEFVPEPTMKAPLDRLRRNRTRHCPGSI